MFISILAAVLFSTLSLLSVILAIRADLESPWLLLPNMLKQKIRIAMMLPLFGLILTTSLFLPNFKVLSIAIIFIIFIIYLIGDFNIIEDFTKGLIAFLIGHLILISYIISIGHFEFTLEKLVYTPTILCLAYTIYYINSYKKEIKDMIVPVNIYLVVLVIANLLAIFCTNSFLLAMGIQAFIISDLIVANESIIKKPLKGKISYFANNAMWYYSGMLLMILGLLFKI